MHPDLAALQQNYDRVIDDYEAGLVGYEEAAATLSQMTALDAEGWVWSIDPSTGGFMRGRPGYRGEVTDPSLFVAVQVKPRGAHMPSGLSDLMNPPGITRVPTADSRPGEGLGAQSASGSGFAAPFGQPSAPVAPPFGHPMDLAGGYDRVPSPIGEASPRRAPRAPQRPKEKTARSLPSFNLTNFRVPGNVRTWVLIAGAIVILVMLALSRHGTSGAAGSGGLPVDSTTPTTTPVTTSSQASSATLDVTTMDAILATLGTADDTSVRAVVTNVGSASTFVVNEALYAGFSKMNLSVTSNVPSVSGSTAVSEVSVSPTTGQAVLTGKASWVLSSGFWKLSSWPVLR
jgi:hypothetical protein